MLDSDRGGSVMPWPLAPGDVRSTLEAAGQATMQAMLVLSFACVVSLALAPWLLPVLTPSVLIVSLRQREGSRAVTFVATTAATVLCWWSLSGIHPESLTGGAGGTYEVLVTSVARGLLALAPALVGGWAMGASVTVVGAVKSAGRAQGDAQPLD